MTVKRFILEGGPDDGAVASASDGIDEMSGYPFFVKGRWQCAIYWRCDGGFKFSGKYQEFKAEET
jgi:hypothetical protein